MTLFFPYNKAPYFNLFVFASAFLGAILSIQLLSAAALFAAEPDSVIDDANKKFEKNELKRKKRALRPKAPELDKFVVSGDDLPFVRLRSVVIKGATVFKGDELKSSYLGLIGKTVSERDLVGITSKITKRYHDLGYALSRAFIPPQDVEGGRVIIKVVEGYVERVVFSGDGARGFGAERLTKPIISERPLKTTTLEHQLLLINEIPGLAVKDTALKEVGEMSGKFELTVFVKTWRMKAVSELDNRGKIEIGPLQSFNYLYLNSVFGRGSSLSLNYSTTPHTTDEFKYGRFALDVPLDEFGTRMNGFLAIGQLRPNDSRRLVDTRFNILQAGVNVNYPLMRRRMMSLTVGGGVWVNDREEVTNVAVKSRDKLRGVDVFANYFHMNEHGDKTYINANLRQGLDFADASSKGDVNLSRTDGVGEFTRLYVKLIRDVVLEKDWSLRLAGALQIGSQGLLAAQEFYIGGAHFGRAFETGSLTGDSGFAASGELRYTRKVEHDWLKKIQLFGFADIGAIFDDGNPNMNGAMISSAGVGSRFYFIHNIEAQLEVVKPLDDHLVNDVDDTEFFFRVGRSFKLDELSLLND